MVIFVGTKILDYIMVQDTPDPFRKYRSAVKVPTAAVLPEPIQMIAAPVVPWMGTVALTSLDGLEARAPARACTL